MGTFFQKKIDNETRLIFMESNSIPMNIPIETNVDKAPWALFPIEIFQLILFKSDFLTQIRLRCVNELFCSKLEIHDFWGDDFWSTYSGCSKYIDNDILRSYPFIRSLDIDSNPNVTNINFLTRLEKLDICATCSIGDAGIANLNLKYLRCRGNKRVTNINHMTKLEYLQAANDKTGISDSSIVNLANLTTLIVWDNTKIRNVGHLTNLTSLNASEMCGIGSTGISNLNLRKLIASNNLKITNVNHMTRLEVLDAGFDCGIGDAGITKLNLRKLYAQNNSRITDVNHMSRLKILHADGQYCGIDDAGISNLKLITLGSYENLKITKRSS